MSSTTRPHHLVAMLLVTRGEFLRALAGLPPHEARVRIGGLNCVGWAVGHMAWQESLFWLKGGQGLEIPPELQIYATGRPGSVPEYEQILAHWHEVARRTEPFLRSLDRESLQRHFMEKDSPLQENAGTLLTRCVMHYWSHIGEIACVRALLGHDVPQFVGSLEGCTYLAGQD